jgi:SET domain-containing protein
MKMNREEIKKLMLEQQTKLGVSNIPGAGVGVFALVDIPKDTLIKGCRAFMEFCNMKEECEFHYDELNEAHPNLQKYVYSMTDGYGDTFCIDAPLFMLYQGYYINHSNTPNCFWDRRTGDIFTQEEIKAGTELTMYYMPSERDF